MKTAIFLVAIGDYAKHARAVVDVWKKLFPRSLIFVAGQREAEQLGCDRWSHPGEVACALKLHVWDLLPKEIDAVLYADMDVAPIDPVGFESALRDVDLAVVRDRWDDHEVNRVADSVGVPRHDYFNAGVIYARRSTEAAFKGAQRFFNRLKWWDQTGLNVAVRAHSLKVRYLPWRMNAMDAKGPGPGIGALHAPHHCKPIWEGRPIKPVRLPCVKEVLGGLDFSHGYVTDRAHLEELAGYVMQWFHVLEVGTFQGHAAWAMAARGALVTTLDPIHGVSKRIHGPHGLSIDAMAHKGEEWLDLDENVYDAVFHDAEHGPHIIPELRQWWDRILPEGFLAVHDAEQLDGWKGDDLANVHYKTVTADRKGRELLIIHKMP